MSEEQMTADWVAHHARVRPHKLAVHDLDTGRRLTYADLDERASRLGRALQGAGVRPGDRVALLAYNGSEYFELLTACARIGAIAVLLNWRLAGPEIEVIVRDAEPTVLLHDPDFVGAAQHLTDAGIEITPIALGEPYERALADADPEQLDRAPTPTSDTPWMLLYTSGTTGRPKGVIGTYGSVFWNAVNVSYPVNIGPDTVLLVALPLFHVGGLNVHATPTILAGGTVLTQRTPENVLAAIGDPELGVTHFTGVPAVYQMLCERPEFASTDLSRLTASMGGSVCPKRVTQAWADRGVPLRQQYGTTESNIIVAMLNPDGADRVTSVGQQVLYTQMRIVTPEGTDAAPGEVGEIWARGPHISPGYWRNQAATDAAFEDGWFKTGDAVRVDEDGYVHIIDRWKDMYISGGENVYPTEIENVLYDLPGVLEVAVVGVPHDVWGETGLAVLVVTPEAQLDTDTVMRHCRERLARYKVPTIINFIETLPRNATGKILKHELRNSHAEQVATGS